MSGNFEYEKKMLIQYFLIEPSTCFLTLKLNLTLLITTADFRFSSSSLVCFRSFSFFLFRVCFVFGFVFKIPRPLTNELGGFYVDNGVMMTPKVRFLWLIWLSNGLRFFVNGWLSRSKAEDFAIGMY